MKINPKTGEACWMRFSANLQSLWDLKKHIEMAEKFSQIFFETNKAITTGFVMPKASKVYRKENVLDIRPLRGRRFYPGNFLQTFNPFGI